MFKRHQFFFALTFLLFAFAVHALQIPKATGEYVNDFASVLSADTKSRLESNLSTFEKETTTQIVVAIFPSIEDESVEDFTVRLAEAWRIGQKQNNNGVLLAIYIQEHKARIEVGYGLEGALTDALSSRIIRSELAPDFKAGNYDAGVEKTVTAIQKAVRGEYSAPPESEKPQQTSYIATLIIFLIVWFLISRIARGPMTIGPYSRRNRYNDTWGGGFGGGSGWGGGGGFGGGGGGGGFSGGGGSFGGGGASGSW
jgi:uncharacterized protein